MTLIKILSTVFKLLIRMNLQIVFNIVVVVFTVANLAAMNLELNLRKALGGCPRIENLLRKSPFGQISRSFSLNSPPLFASNDRKI